jgi:hypothetical protein
VWYWNAFDKLDAQGHIGVDGRASGNVAARLSADGRLYVRSVGTNE